MNETPTMRTSEQIGEIAAALAKAQGLIEGAKKGRENPHFKSKYADLASIWDACREALSVNGLSVVQVTAPSTKDEVVVITRLMHASGQWYEGVLAMPVSKGDAQGFGSALTYTRRYALAAMVGVAPEDDDGNLAAAAKPNGKAGISEKDEADLLASLDEATSADDLRERTAKVLAIAHQGGDVEAHKRLKARAVSISERFKATVQ